MAKLRMNDPYQIRKTLQKVAEEVAEGELDVQSAKLIVYACQTSLQAISTEEKIKDMVQARATAEKWDFI